MSNFCRNTAPHALRPGARPSLARGVLALAAIAAVALPATVQAQSGRSYIPYTASGYAGFAIGRADYRLDCATGFSCDNTTHVGKAYLGGMFNPWLGVELGYIRFGSVGRNDGRTRAHGLNLALVGNVPIVDQFSVFGKLGTTYSRTSTTASPFALTPTGGDSGWGPAFGVGLRWKFSRQASAVLEWERHRLHFADDKADAHATLLGVRWEF